MRKENILVTLWICFGFLLITTINSSIYLIVHLIYFGLFELGVSLKIMTPLIPIITLILYSALGLLLIKKINIESNIYLKKFPKKLIILLAVIALILYPITKLLSGIYAGYSWEKISSKDYALFDSWLQMGFIISQILLISLLLIVFTKKLKNIPR